MPPLWGQVLSRVGSLEPVRLVSVFASIVPSFENLRQPVLLPLAFFPGSQLPARLARHPFSVFSPPIRVFLRRYLSPAPSSFSPPFFPPPDLSTFSPPSPIRREEAKPSSLSRIRRPPLKPYSNRSTRAKGKSFRISPFSSISRLAGKFLILQKKKERKRGETFKFDRRREIFL